MFPSSCQRCGDTPLGISSMSRFNTQHICTSCLDLEQAHPAYAAARDAEQAAVESGNYNFPGVGCPPDLVESSCAARVARAAPNPGGPR